MSEQNFTVAFSVDQTPEEVFDAINNVRGWWSGEIIGATDKLGAEFTYSVPDAHRSKQKITEFVPGKKVVWHVLDAHLSFVKDKDEWKGTDIVFEIAKKGDENKIDEIKQSVDPSEIAAELDEAIARSAATLPFRRTRSARQCWHP